MEVTRALMVAKRSARAERIQTINQARALIPTGPDDLRARFAQHTVAGLVPGSPYCARGPAMRRAMPSALERVLGPDYPDTRTARANLAYWTRQGGQQPWI